MQKQSKFLTKSGLFSLSANLYTHSSDVQLRFCDAICDISIHDPENVLTNPQYVLSNAVFIPFVKENSRWVLPHQLFTADKPVYVVHMPYSLEYIDLHNTDETKEIEVAWTSILLPETDRRPRSTVLSVMYGDKEFLYENGIVTARQKQQHSNSFNLPQW